jgi:hypothetical protein
MEGATVAVVVVLVVGIVGVRVVAGDVGVGVNVGCTVVYCCCVGVVDPVVRLLLCFVGICSTSMCW